jgi:hypothetical protein
MTLYTERSSAHLTVATDCIISFNDRSNSKDADSGKRKTTKVLLSGTQKFLLEVTGLSARNVDHGVCVTKLHAIGRCKYA